MRLGFGSVRAKLIATTMLAFGAVLGVATVVTDLSYRHTVMLSIDDFLKKAGGNLAEMSLHRHPRHRDDDRGPQREPRQNDGKRSDDGRDFHPHEPPPARDPKWADPAFLPVGFVPKEMDVSKLAYDLPGYREALVGRTFFSTIVVDGEPRRVISVPMREHGRVEGVVQLPYGLGTTLNGLKQSEQTLVRVIFPLCLVLAGTASYLVVLRLMKPLRQMATEAERIGREGFGERLQPLGADEFAALAGTLNTMLARLEELYRREKDTSERLAKAVEQQRRFTSDASHELKTPLTVIKGHLGVLRQSRRPAREEVESLQDMEEASSRMSLLLQDLLTLARTDAGISKPKVECSINEVIDKAISSILGASDRTILDANGEYMAIASPEELDRVFANLIENALKHSESRQPISLRIYEENSWIVVVVEDFGVGIEARHLPHLFERFYRADESRTSETGGSGLGLAICQELVKANRGFIQVESERGKGTRFSVRIPTV